jgi:sterol desaturase/sphingolipid hydroxylase (fatty acid hydroxylase superfamily)
MLGGSTAMVVELGTEVAYPLAVLGAVALLSALEAAIPRRPDWKPSLSEVGSTLCLVAGALVVGGALTIAYQATLSPALEAFRTSHNLTLWPNQWPLVAQLFLAFFLSELGWYWLHRASHNLSFMWRATGHGAHHSFHHLGALHFSANHPFELPVLLLPVALLELVLGAGEAAAAAGIVLVVNSAIAHSNLDLNSRGIDWLFTTNRHHIHHHSVVRRESNTNYGCSAMLWDHVFGTFENGETAATGIGHSEPPLLEKLWLPFREPEDIQVAP